MQQQIPGFRSHLEDLISHYQHAVVAPDGSRLGIFRVGFAEHDPSRLDDIESLPDHGQDGAGCHVLDEPGEEGLRGQVGVVLTEMRSGGLEKEMDGSQCNSGYTG